MENQNTEDKMYEKFIWRINSFPTLDSEELYSENFVIDDHTWRILIYPKGYENLDYLGIYLETAEDPANLPSGWKKFADFKLALINQVNSDMNQTYASVAFNENVTEWGFQKFIRLGELHDSSNGFIVNDNCILQVEILVKKSKHHNGVDQSVSKTESKSVELIDNPLHKEMISTSYGELVDFRGLGKVEQDFVPLLEQVCSRHPSLIDSMQKRSQRFIEWALTALGRVLHFLKNKKGRDMDDDAYNHLQLLWEELEICRFDLTWLEPHVKSALRKKTYVERSVRLKRLRENKIALEMETEMLKKRMIEIAVDLEITRKELIKVSEGFNEFELDAVLGYGRP